MEKAEEVKWFRTLGEILADLEDGQELSLNEITERLLSIVKALPDFERRAANLARLIQRMKRTKSPKQVSDLLTEGMKIGAVITIPSQEEVERAKRDPFQKRLLVFIKEPGTAIKETTTWRPMDWNNRAHQALVISARRAMGRIKKEAPK